MTEPSRTKGTPSDIDAYVGKNLFKLRQMAGLSQEGLAKVSGVSFQQIQKYEKGANRIAAGRLFEFSRILGVTPNDFFTGYNNFYPKNQAHESEENAGGVASILDYPPELETVVKAFSKIPVREERVAAAKGMIGILKLFLEK